MKPTPVRKWNSRSSVNIDRKQHQSQPDVRSTRSTSIGVNQTYTSSASLPSGNRVSTLLAAEQRRRQQRGFLIQNGDQTDSASSELAPTTLQSEEEEKNGILFVAAIIKSSPADEAGMKCGDIFVKFGVFTKATFSSLSKIPPLIRDSAGKIIPTTVLRRSSVGNGYFKTDIDLTPALWSDGGVLGIVLNTWPPPKPRPRKLGFVSKENQRVNTSKEVSPILKIHVGALPANLPLLSIQSRSTRGMPVVQPKFQPTSAQNHGRKSHRVSNSVANGPTTATLTFR